MTFNGRKNLGVQHSEVYDFIKKSGGFSIKVLIERIRVQLRKKDTKEIKRQKIKKTKETKHANKTKTEFGNAKHFFTFLFS